jgi:hypothetical protein
MKTDAPWLQFSFLRIIIFIHYNFSRIFEVSQTFKVFSPSTLYCADKVVSYVLCDFHNSINGCLSGLQKQEFVFDDKVLYSLSNKN